MSDHTVMLSFEAQNFYDKWCDEIHPDNLPEFAQDIQSVWNDGLANGTERD